MFRDSLLENSLTTRKRWPVLLAFTLEVLAGAALVAIPLLSSGVIPVAARPPLYSPVTPVRVEAEPLDTNARPGEKTGLRSAPSIVTIANMHPTLTIGRPTPDDTRIGIDVLVPAGPKPSGSVPDLRGGCDDCSSVTTEPIKRMRMSSISPGHLIHRVEPTYPRLANLTHLQGEVKLHAIIARDGSIEDLSVTSGHPLLAAAAMDAVKQWRYRPFLLNGQPVEVETTVTVNFRRSGN